MAEARVGGLRAARERVDWDFELADFEFAVFDLADFDLAAFDLDFSELRDLAMNQIPSYPAVLMTTAGDTKAS